MFSVSDAEARSSRAHASLTSGSAGPAPARRTRALPRALRGRRARVAGRRSPTWRLPVPDRGDRLPRASAVPDPFAAGNSGVDQCRRREGRRLGLGGVVARHSLRLSRISARWSGASAKAASAPRSSSSCFRCARQLRRPAGRRTSGFRRWRGPRRSRRAALLRPRVARPAGQCERRAAARCRCIRRVRESDVGHEYPWISIDASHGSGVLRQRRRSDSACRTSGRRRQGDHELVTINVRVPSGLWTSSHAT